VNSPNPVSPARSVAAIDGSTNTVEGVAPAEPRKKTSRDTLYLQVLIAIVAGALLGHFAPDAGAKLKPLGDAFVKLIGMLAAPIVFTTVVLGLAGMGDLKQLGRIGLKALIYFEIVTTLALAIGLVVANGLKPGGGINADPASFDPTSVAQYTTAAKGMSTTDFLLDLIPRSFLGAFVDGRVLQVLLLSILCGIALAMIGDHARPLVNFLNAIARGLFAVVAIVVRFAPIAAFGAMAFTIGKYGLGTLLSLGALMACVYVTCAVFVCVILGSVARLAGFRLWKILKYIREEILIVLGTSSSEAGMPGLMEKMERVGCSRTAVGIVVPAGFSFNLDGTCIYVTIAAMFIAQATNTPLTGPDVVGLLLVLLLTSKGAAAVTGGGFITLAATLAAVGKIPIGGLALIVGVDRFMSEARAITNLIGNAVATLVIAKWDGQFDATKAAAVLSTHRTGPLAQEPRASSAEKNLP
jgi:aerobic C4-dicarboxylate transport protein